MNGTPHAVNFDELVAYVTNADHYRDATRFAVWGGECSADQLPVFLKGWNLPNANMPYCIWETMSEMRFKAQTLPADVAELERGRVFGPRGDLSLRRDSERFLWHFVGEKGVNPPAEFDKAENDFWQAEPDAQFLMTEDTLLLWGERKDQQPRWFEDRVARAKLTYPIAGTPSGRAQVRYRAFTRAGQVELVWFMRLEEVQHG